MLVNAAGCVRVPNVGADSTAADAPSECTAKEVGAEQDLMAWDSASRSDLSRLRHEGIVAVRAAKRGCGIELRLLTHCIGTKAAYSFSPYWKSDTKEATTSGQLFARLPIGAAHLESELSGDREVRTDFVLAGQYSLPASLYYARTDLTGPDCGKATHVVTTVFVGGFRLASGDRRSLSAEASIFGAGVGGRHETTTHVLDEEGDADQCEQSKKDSSENVGCATPLRLTLLALDGLAEDDQADAPRLARGDCPSGMVSLPGGSYAESPGEPSRNVSPFCLDVTEVTTGAYRHCVQGGACSADRMNEGPHGLEATMGPEPQCNLNATGREDHPINCVDWNQADAYCKSQGKRLPTASEWEWAARGLQLGRSYPWGNAAPDAQLCWSGVDKRDGTCPVGSFPAGDAPGNIHDLAGDVEEWTSSRSSYGDDDDAREMRGGAWNGDVASSFRATAYWAGSRDYRGAFLGFRCAR
jgi:hypothetical protein